MGFQLVPKQLGDLEWPWMA